MDTATSGEADLEAAALEVRLTHAAGSAARLLADAYLATSAPKRRDDVTRNRRLFVLAQMLIIDGVPKMKAYAFVAERFHVSPEQARRLFTQQAEKHPEQITRLIPPE